MENYELTFIISISVPEIEHKKIQDNVISYIKGINGEWKKKLLSP